MSQGKSKLAMYIAIPVVLVVVIVSLVQLTYHILRRQNRGDASNVCGNSFLIILNARTYIIFFCVTVI